jgi:hypothetical protein
MNNMKQEHPTVFFKALMTGLFIGIIDTLICLTYNIGFRNYTGYTPSALINVSSVIFIVNLTLLVIAIVFYAFHQASRKGDTIYFIFFLALTAFLIWKIGGIRLWDNARDNTNFRGLLGGIVVIVGLSAAALPFLFRSRKFIDAII